MDKIIKTPEHRMTLQTYGELMPYRLQENKQVKTAMAMVCDQIARVNGKEMQLDDVKFIVDEIFDMFSHETLNDHLQAFKLLARSKVYGHITLPDLIECHHNIQHERALERERDHERNKGFGNSEVRTDELHRFLTKKNNGKK